MHDALSEPIRPRSPVRVSYQTGAKKRAEEVEKGGRRTECISKRGAANRCVGGLGGGGVDPMGAVVCRERV